VHTLRKNNIDKETTPRMVSHLLILCASPTTDCHDCKNPVACPAIPRKFLIWDDAIVKAAAEVKPAMTGYEKNSKTKPAEWKIER
jgi:hypothetical protein